MFLFSGNRLQFTLQSIKGEIKIFTLHFECPYELEVYSKRAQERGKEICVYRIKSFSFAKWKLARQMFHKNKITVKLTPPMYIFKIMMRLNTMFAFSVTVIVYTESKTAYSSGYPLPIFNGVLRKVWTLITQYFRLQLNVSGLQPEIIFHRQPQV